MWVWSVSSDLCGTVTECDSRSWDFHQVCTHLEQLLNLLSSHCWCQHRHWSKLHVLILVMSVHPFRADGLELWVTIYCTDSHLVFLLQSWDTHWALPGSICLQLWWVDLTYEKSFLDVPVQCCRVLCVQISMIEHKLSPRGKGEHAWTGCLMLFGV